MKAALLITMAARVTFSQMEESNDG
jgi:hypothetical protein